MSSRLSLSFLTTFIRWLTARETLHNVKLEPVSIDHSGFYRWLFKTESKPNAPLDKKTDEQGALQWLFNAELLPGEELEKTDEQGALQWLFNAELLPGEELEKTDEQGALQWLFNAESLAKAPLTKDTSEEGAIH